MENMHGALPEQEEYKITSMAVRAPLPYTQQVELFCYERGDSEEGSINVETFLE